MDLYHDFAASELTSEYGSAIEMASHRYIDLLLTHVEQAYPSCSQCQGLTSWHPLRASRYLTYVRDYQDIESPSWLKRAFESF